MIRSIGVGVLLTGALAGGVVMAAPVQSPPENAYRTDYLYILEQAAERVRVRLQALRRSPQADPEEIAEHQRYLDRLESQIAARRQASGTGKTMRPSATRTRPVVPRLGPAPRVVVVPETTERDDVASLDSKLDMSLGSFDDMLLQEVETLSEKSRRGRPDGSPEGRGTEGTGGTGGDSTGDTGRSASDESGDSRERGGASASGTTGTGEEERRTETGVGATVLRDDAGGRGARGDPSGRKAKPPADIPDGSDDDVVARQIREAAENEADPALREKLWDEYRMYKRGAS